MKRIIWGMAMFVLAAGSADAALLSRAGGQAYYDTTLNITWLADANLAATNTFGVSGIGTFSSGDMPWNTANDWIAAMNAANHIGAHDWRLPLTAQPDASCSGQYFGLGFGSGCAGSEMGHLYNVDGISDLTPGPFSNVQYNPYWSGTAYAPDPGKAWFFLFNFGGFQDDSNKDYTGYAWAVRPGDIAAVPVPGALWLFGTGLAALGAKLKRRVRGAEPAFSKNVVP